MKNFVITDLIRNPLGKSALLMGLRLIESSSGQAQATMTGGMCTARATELGLHFI